MLSTPSLAQATNTRLDTACKHIQQCRVSQDHLVKFANFDEHELMRNKFGYCVHKDELVLGIGLPWNKDDKKLQNAAYPRVVSCLGRLADRQGNELREAAKMIKWMYHNTTSIQDRDDALNAIRNGDNIPDNDEGAEPYFKQNEQSGEWHYKSEVRFVYDFVTIGYANTLGWGHAHHGDTMTSVLIGGLRTVMNGDFEMFTGDVIQWYWPFERDCFLKTGRRKPVDKTNRDPGTIAGEDGKWSLSKDSQARKRFSDREYGQPRGYDRDSQTFKDIEKCVALIKPFKEDDEENRLYDRYRVFAIAISSARPREAVDIRICRQAI